MDSNFSCLWERCIRVKMYASAINCILDYETLRIKKNGFSASGVHNVPTPQVSGKLTEYL